MAKNVFAKFTESELQVKLQELKAELFNFRFQQATGKLENFRKLRAIKKDIARVSTFLTTREKAKV